MTGVKRNRIENDDQENHFAPKDYAFNFTPTLKPSQKIFNVGATIDNSNFKPVNYSISTLSHRFRKRAEEKKQKKKLNLNYNNTPNNSHIALVTNNHPYEPMYLRHQTFHIPSSLIYK
ncbi:unnamed protein product [Mucor hiemalis]